MAPTVLQKSDAGGSRGDLATADAASAAASDAAKEDLRALLSRFALGRVYGIRRLIAGSTLAPKFVADTEAGRVVIKRRGSSADAASIRATHHVQRLAAARGVPVPRLLLPINATEPITIVGDRVYEVAAFMPGRAYPATPAAAGGAGAAVGAMHAVMCVDGGQAGVLVREAPGEETVLATLHGLERTSAALAGTARRLAALWVWAVDTQSSANQAPTGLLHGDIHPGNVLFSDEKTVAALLDFDRAAWGNQADEAAMAAMLFALPKLGPAARSWQRHPHQAVLAAFWSHYREHAKGLDHPVAAAARMTRVLIEQAALGRPSGPWATAQGLLELRVYVADVAAWLRQHGAATLASPSGAAASADPHA